MKKQKTLSKADLPFLDLACKRINEAGFDHNYESKIEELGGELVQVDMEADAEQVEKILEYLSSNNILRRYNSNKVDYNEEYELSFFEVIRPLKFGEWYKNYQYASLFSPEKWNVKFLKRLKILIEIAECYMSEIEYADIPRTNFFEFIDSYPTIETLGAGSLVDFERQMVQDFKTLEREKIVSKVEEYEEEIRVYFASINLKRLELTIDTFLDRTANAVDYSHIATSELLKILKSHYTHSKHISSLFDRYYKEANEINFNAELYDLFYNSFDLSKYFVEEYESNADELLQERIDIKYSKYLESFFNKSASIYDEILNIWKTKLSRAQRADETYKFFYYKLKEYFDLLSESPNIPAQLVKRFKIIDEKRKNQVKFDRINDNNIDYEIKYSTKREVILNNTYLLSNPNFNSENDVMFEFLIKNPNQTFSRKDIETKTGIKLSKDFDKIVENLGFKKDLRKIFFEVSKDKILFRNPVSKEQLEEMNLTFIKI